MDQAEEKLLIEQCKVYPVAFARIFDEWYKPIFAYVFRRITDYDLSKDITAETFLKAYLNISGFTWKGVRLSSWLYRIATNEINQYCRNKSYKPLSLEQLLEDPKIESIYYGQANDEQEILEAELKAHEDYNQIIGVLIKLDVKYQEVIALRYFEQKQIKEIAEILSKNEGTVKSLISRGLEKLRKLL